MSCESLKWCFSTWDMPGSCKQQIEHTEVSRRLEEAWAGSEGSRPWRLSGQAHRRQVWISTWPPQGPRGARTCQQTPGGPRRLTSSAQSPRTAPRTRTCIHRCSTCRYHGITGSPRPPTLRHMTPSWGRAGRRLRNPEDWTFTLKRLSHPREII